MSGKLWFPIWVLFLWGSCSGRFVVEKNSLKVTSPDSLKGVYECAIGNFGIPQYGGTMVGIVVYPKSNKKACKSFDEFDISYKSKPGGFPTFLLVDRGDCFFTTKAWNAQNAGAAAILVADNKVEPLITMDTPEEDNGGDDHRENITIPSALVSQRFGDSLKKTLEDGDMVNVNLDWRESLPHPDERVEYEFWTNSNDECGPKCDSQIDFVKNIKDCFFTTKAWNAQNAGAAAILVADNKVEPLITMDTPEEDNGGDDHRENITIPSALVSQRFGDSLKKALEDGDMVNVNLDWRESLPHPDERVEYEFWTNSNDECGPKCDSQIDFVKNFKGAAQILEQKGYTQFTPHYITWYCPEAFILSKQCKSQCINHGRYCAPDPEQDFSRGYDGKDVVVQNLRQVCLFKVANETGKPWLWWDYVTDFAIRCPMKEKKYTKECAEEVIRSLGVDIRKINDCIGDPEADEHNPVLKAEQDAQIGKDSRGDVTILPTLVINNRQYRGKLDKGAVLKAICAGFQETTEPAVCLSEDIQTNECLENNGGCWQDKAANVTACKDTFRGRVCQCPVVQGVKFVGDGYTHCEASGSGRCEINNGGCWKETKDGNTFSACVDDHSNRCKCPPGFKGDGVNSCEDVDECKEKSACQCSDCKCKNTWGSYDCSCRGNLLYMREHDTCISKEATTEVSWSFLWVIFLGLGIAGVGGYAVYKYRIRSYMDSEIRAIMAQYMPLDNTAEGPNHVQHPDI